MIGLSHTECSDYKYAAESRCVEAERGVMPDRQMPAPFSPTSPLLYGLRTLTGVSEEMNTENKSSQWSIVTEGAIHSRSGPVPKPITWINWSNGIADP